MLVAHRLSGPKLSPACRRAACFALIFVTIAVLLGACDNEPVPTATTQPANTPTALATSTPAPSGAPTRTPTRASAPNPSPTPSHTPTQTPIPAAIPSQKPTAEPQPTSTAIQSPTRTPAPTPTAEEIAASRLSEIVPWFENPQADPHGFVTELLVDLWLSNRDLGNKVAGFPWVTDGVTDGERNFVAALGRIARADLELAKTVANLNWVSDDVNDKERVTIQILDRIASEDIELARQAVSFQWFAAEAPVDSMMTLSRLRKIGANKVELAELLIGLWFSDVDLGAAVAGFPWGNGGVTGNERALFAALSKITHADLELAKTVAALPWLSDGVSRGEPGSIQKLEEIASDDVELARQVAGLQWFLAGMPNDSMGSLWTLRKISANNVDLAMLVVRSSWFEDGLTSDELISLGALWRIAANDHLELARNLAGSPLLAANQHRDLQVHALAFLGQMAAEDPHALDQLTALPWFADGLDEEEMALVVTLGWAAGKSPELYDDLLRTHYTQYRAASLPLAGDVNIWIFQNTPFPPDEDLSTVIEDTARISEGLLGVPFPTTDIILLVVDDVDRRYGSRLVGHYRGLMVLKRRPLGVPSVPHETAHYYFNRGPQWLREGGSEFIETYVKDRTGVQSISDRKTEVSQRAQSRCFDLNEVDNIRHYVYLRGNTSGVTGQCPYYMGENFLLKVFETIGEEAMASALRELYPLVLGRERFEHIVEREEEDLVFDTFVKHVPATRLEEFRGLYRRLHGGPSADPGIDFSDDHGDEVAAATEIAEEEVVEGSLDYHFDFDYFKFRAEEGQRYRIHVARLTLRSSSVILYGSDGTSRERLVDKWTDEGHVSCNAFQRPGRVYYGAQLRWVAPSSGEYYLAVHNFAGASGLYTLEITPVTPIPDDHGDSVATASELAVGGVVDGVVDYDFDLDFFRLQAVAGRKYRVSIEAVVRPFFAHVHLYSPDGNAPTRLLALDYYDGLGRGGSSHSEWVAPSSGEYYFVAGGGCGTVGTYKLIVAESSGS